MTGPARTELVSILRTMSCDDEYRVEFEYIEGEVGITVRVIYADDPDEVSECDLDSEATVRLCAWFREVDAATDRVANQQEPI